MSKFMESSFNDFANTLKEIDERLSKSNVEILKKEQKIFDILDNAKSKLNNISGCENKTNELSKIVSYLQEQWPQLITSWKQRLELKSEIRSNIEKFGTGLIVAVFGSTKAGKSTFGNFIRGKQLLDAPFNNAWSDGSLEQSKICALEGNESAEVVTSDEWFAVGAVETTRSVKLFRMKGLLWLDTPGFGSINGHLGEMAKKYVERCDLIVYLENADHPGLKSLVEEASGILKKNKLTILINCKSDDQEYRKVIGEDGKVKLANVRIAKSESIRAGHNKILSDSFKKFGYENGRVLSVSTQLATDAIKENSDELYKGSNLDSLFKLIRETVLEQNDVLELKQEEYRQNLANLIDEILVNDDETISLQSLSDSIIQCREKYSEARKKWNNPYTFKTIFNQVFKEAKRSVDRLISRIEDLNCTVKDRKNKGTEFKEQQSIINSSINELAIKIQNDAIEAVSREVKNVVESLGHEIVNLNASKFKDIKVPTIKEDVETIEVQRIITVNVRRDPSGFFEHVASIFGRKYYSYSIEKEKENKEISHGIDTNSLESELTESIKEQINNCINDLMGSIEQQCFVYSEDIINQSLSILDEAKTQLIQYKNKI